MTDANEALRALDEMYRRIDHIDGALCWEEQYDIIRAHLKDSGYVRVGYVAMCDDGSVFYEYFAQTKEGVELAIKNDGWEEMRAVPVYAATKDTSHD